MPVAPTIDRTTLVQGPGHLLYGSGLTSVYYCSQIRAELVTETFPVDVAGFGPIEHRKADEIIRITCTPAGQFSAALAALLWPYGSTAVGTTIFGATDVPMGIQTLAGQKLALTAAAITRMPAITVGAAGFLAGDFEITGVVGKTTARTAAAALYTLASAAWSGQPAASGFVSLPAAATWALGTPETIVAKAGWTIEFDLQLAPQRTLDLGTFDIRFQGCEVRARCLPVGYAESKWADLKVQ